MKNNLFDKKFINKLIKDNKEMLQNDVFKPVILCETSKSDKFLVLPFELVNDFSKQLGVDDYTAKRMFFSSIYSFFQSPKIAQEYGTLEKLLFITDAYMLKTKNPYNLNTPIHDDPNRTESLLISGRDRANTEQVTIAVPYIRVNNQLVFEKAIKGNSKNKTESILDYAFIDPLLTVRVEEAKHKKNNNIN